MKKLISIIVPVYNEEKCISVFFDELKKHFSDLSEFDFEIIFIEIRQM